MEKEVSNKVGIMFGYFSLNAAIVAYCASYLVVDVYFFFEEWISAEGSSEAASNSTSTYILVVLILL